MAHIHKDIDFTVSVFVVHNGKVALHIHKKYGMWLPPGGHVELNEHPNEAALREVTEECGLSVELISPHAAVPQMEEEGFVNLIAPMYLNIHTAAPEHRHCDHVYFAVSKNDVIVPEQDEEWRWWSREELEADTTLWPSVRFYALEALKEVSAR